MRRRVGELRFRQVGSLVDEAKARGDLPRETDTDLILTAITAPLHLAAVTDSSLPPVSPRALVRLVLAGAGHRPRHAAD